MQFSDVKFAIVRQTVTVLDIKLKYYLFGISPNTEFNSFEILRLCAIARVQIYFLHVVLSQNGKSVI